MRHLRLYAAPLEDVNQGWVRIWQSDLPHRSIVKLTTRNSSKYVYCEVLSIDPNFIRAYNKPGRIHITDSQSAFVAAEWYRTRLGGLKTQADAEIEVKPVNNIYGRVRACLHHPQIAIRLATILGLWGFFLGAFGVILGLMPFFGK